ncbi:hypothetical protein DND90_10250 [Pseudomonas syringae pv. maculicola]|nr:hypothetical protein DND90_10250 [Pseudomonas syringae pv. maculicola]
MGKLNPKQVENHANGMRDHLRLNNRNGVIPRLIRNFLIADQTPYITCQSLSCRRPQQKQPHRGDDLLSDILNRVDISQRNRKCPRAGSPNLVSEHEQ